MASDQLDTPAWIEWAKKNILQKEASSNQKCYINFNEFLKLAKDTDGLINLQFIIQSLPSKDISAGIPSTYYHSTKADGTVLLDRNTFIWFLLTSPKYCHLAVVVPAIDFYARHVVLPPTVAELSIISHANSHVIFLCRMPILEAKMEEAVKMDPNMGCYKIAYTHDIETAFQDMCKPTLICIWNAISEEIGLSVIQLLYSHIKMADANIFWADGEFIKQCVTQISQVIRNQYTYNIRNKMINQLSKIT